MSVPDELRRYVPRTDLYDSAELISYHMPVEQPPATASYIIFKKGNKTYAKNGLYGHIEFESTKADEVINPAINNLDEGGIIHIKQGRYILYDSITLTNHYVVIEGETQHGSARVGTELYLASNVQKNVIVAPKASALGGIIIRNLYINGNSGGNPDKGVDGEQCGIYIGASTFFAISNVHVRYATRQGIYLASCNLGCLNNIVVRNCGREGISLDNTLNTTATNLRAYDNTMNNLDISTNTDKDFYISIIGGIFLSGGDNGVAIRNTGTGTYTKRISLIGLHCKGNTNRGIYLNNAQETIVQGCICVENDTGVEEDGGSDYNIIVGNIIRANTTNQLVTVGTNTVTANNITA